MHRDECESILIYELENTSNAWVEKTFGVSEAPLSSFSRDHISKSSPMRVCSVTTVTVNEDQPQRLGSQYLLQLTQGKS